MNLFYNYNSSGIFLVGYSIIFGIETAKSFRGFLNRLNISSGKEGSKIFINCKVDSYRCQLIVMAISVVALGILWGVSGALVKAEFKNGGNVAQLWFACMVGPIGVWIRWFLARLNGRGLGKAGLFKWIPFGTLIANVSAACIMAALSTVKNAVISTPSMPNCIIQSLSACLDFKFKSIFETKVIYQRIKIFTFAFILFLSVRFAFKQAHNISNFNPNMH